ncbi:MAG: hypothetical protein D4S01_05115 [Dehalococcoidia bacterium]|nr:MAG: hypothetical protein D4S01_05115 [Dehalococcoidia bacterium]
MNNNMDISFGRTVYVARCGATMLDAIENEAGINPSMTGDGLVCIDWEDLPEEDPGDVTQASIVEAYLWKVSQAILEISPNRSFGDVIFSK